MDRKYTRTTAVSKPLHSDTDQLTDSYDGSLASGSSNLIPPRQHEHAIKAAPANIFGAARKVLRRG